MKSKLFLLSIALIICVVGIISCHRRPILLGAIYNLHGGLSSLGIPSSHGLKLAINELNSHGGIQGREIKLFLEDGYTNPDTIRAATKRLIKRKVVSIIGFNDSDMVLAASEEISKSGIPYITPGATAPILIKKMPNNLFLGCFGDNVQAAAGAEFAKTKLDFFRAFLITNKNTEYTKYLNQYFKESWFDLGGDVIGDMKYGNNPSDSITILNALKSKKNDYEFIYLAASPPDVGLWVRLIRKAGISAPIIGGDGYDTPLLVKLAGKNADNVYFTTHAWMNKNGSSEQMKQFYVSYNTLYGVDPENSFAALAYDAAMLFADAASRAKKIDNTHMLEAIASTSEFQGITGKMKYVDGSHIPIKEVVIVGVTKGELSLEAVIMPEHVPKP